jgi:hypothetical protein
MRLVTDDPAVYWAWVFQNFLLVMAGIALIFLFAFIKVYWWDSRKKRKETPGHKTYKKQGGPW